MVIIYIPVHYKSKYGIFGKTREGGGGDHKCPHQIVKIMMILCGRQTIDNDEVLLLCHNQKYQEAKKNKYLLIS